MTDGPNRNQFGPNNSNLLSHLTLFSHPINGLYHNVSPCHFSDRIHVSLINYSQIYFWSGDGLPGPPFLWWKWSRHDVSIIHCDTIALLIVNCHLTLWNLHAAQPHLYKISNDCMYASWNLYCHCSATQSPAICDRVALFIATGSPCLLRQGRLVLLKVRVNPSRYCNKRCLVYHTKTGSKFCDFSRLVYSK